MKGMMGGAALVAAMMAIAPIHAEAQMGSRGQRGTMGRRAEPGVEHIMRLRERLELSEAQIAQLDAIRAEVVQHRASQQAAMAEFRSQMMAGQLEEDAAREQRDSRRAAGDAFAEGVRSRVEELLTDAQREELEDVVGRARAFERGRASMQRQGQRGARAGRGAQRGMSRQGAMGRRGGFRQQRMDPQRMRGAARGRMMRRGGDSFGLPPLTTG